MVRKRDQFWEHAEQLEGKFKCKFCDKIFPGGVSRVKPHLSGIKGCGIDICTRVPEHVQLAAADAISGPNKRIKTVACSGFKENSPKILMSKDSVMLDKLLAKFILLNDINVDIVQRPSFTDFVNAVAEHGSHYRLPCCSAVKTTLMPDLEKEIGEHVANVKRSWDRTGCTLMSVIWCDNDRSFINIFAYSIEGMVLLNSLDVHKDESTETLLQEILYFVTQETGAHKIVQYISARKEGFHEDRSIGNVPHVYETNCVAHQVHLYFDAICTKDPWVRKAFDQARVVVTKIHKLDGILSSLKQFTSKGRLIESSTTKFYTNYYMLQLILGAESELRSLVSSSKWSSLGFQKGESVEEVGEIIRSSEFWSEGKEVLHALEPIFQVLCLVDSYGATSGFLYASVDMADDALGQLYETNADKYLVLWETFKLRKKNIVHPVHAAAAFLNPAYMCSEKFKENDAMKQGMDFIVEKLVAGEEKVKFVQEMMLYRAKEPKLFTCTAVTMLKTSHPCDWWDYCGDVLPVLKKYAIRILSQPCSTSFCRQGLTVFETVQTEKRKPLMTAVMDDYLYLRTDALLMESFNMMKGKIKKPLDLEKPGELPDFTEFVNGTFSHDLSNETKVPLPDGKLNRWSASATKEGESKKHLRLHFITKLPASLVKGNEVKGERGAPIHVILVDSSTGRVVRSGPFSVLQLMVTVVDGDFDEEAGKIWTRECFTSNEIWTGEDDMPLLTGDVCVFLDKGLGKLGGITFNDKSSWTSRGKFRLGVKTGLGCHEGIGVLEGISNAFAVQNAGPLPGFGRSYASTSYSSEAVPSQQFEVSFSRNYYPAQAFNPNPTSSFMMRNASTGLYSGDNSPLAADMNVSQSEKHTFQSSSSSAWMPGNGSSIGPLGEAEVGVYSFFPDNVVHIHKKTSPMGNWCKIQAVVKWMSVRSIVVLRKMSRLPYYCNFSLEHPP